MASKSTDDETARQAHRLDAAGWTGSADLAAWVAENALTLRLAHEWTQPEMAQRMSVELGKSFETMTVSRLENGQRGITVSEIEALARVFRVQPQDLLERPQRLRWRAGMDAQWLAARQHGDVIAGAAAGFYERLSDGNGLEVEHAAAPDFPDLADMHTRWPNRPGVLDPLRAVLAAAPVREGSDIDGALARLAAELGLTDPT